MKKEEPAKSGAEVLPLSTLAPDPRNPRKMDREAEEGLAVSMETFGPLDIVFNLRTGQLVSGHQRIRTLRAAVAIEVHAETETAARYITKTPEDPKGDKGAARFQALAPGEAFQSFDVTGQVDPDCRVEE